jgi:multiple sugar transport system permease protein
MALIFRTIFEFKYFDLIYLITQGGPLGTTKTLPIFIYNLTFEQLSLGRGSAAAVVMFVVTLIASVVYIRFFEKSSERLT